MAVGGGEDAMGLEAAARLALLCSRERVAGGLDGSGGGGGGGGKGEGGTLVDALAAKAIEDALKL
jgi:hypothetical protein